MDQTDKRIIEELCSNSRITMKELGERVHLTGPAAAARVEKLEDNGVIEGYSIKVNQAKLGVLYVCLYQYLYRRYTSSTLSLIYPNKGRICHQ